MIDAIFASKLYRNSKYKSRIDSAITDPINQELVKQLSSYLDDDTIAELSSISDPSDELGPSDDTSIASDQPENIDETQPDAEKDDMSYDMDPDDNTATDDKEHDLDENEDIESAESLEPVLTSTEDIMAMLNQDPRTSGATRTCTKGNETWIYYNDDTNMNDILTDVIQCLHVDGCSDLEFNRLARSDNAIVFTSACR